MFIIYNLDTHYLLNIYDPLVYDILYNEVNNISFLVDDFDNKFNYISENLLLGFHIQKLLEASITIGQNLIKLDSFFLPVLEHIDMANNLTDLDEFSKVYKYSRFLREISVLPYDDWYDLTDLIDDNALDVDSTLFTIWEFLKMRQKKDVDFDFYDIEDHFILNFFGDVFNTLTYKWQYYQKLIVKNKMLFWFLFDYLDYDEELVLKASSSRILEQVQGDPWDSELTWDLYYDTMGHKKKKLYDCMLKADDELSVDYVLKVIIPNNKPKYFMFCQFYYYDDYRDSAPVLINDWFEFKNVKNEDDLYGIFKKNIVLCAVDQDEIKALIYPLTKNNNIKITPLGQLFNYDFFPKEGCIFINSTDSFRNIIKNANITDNFDSSKLLNYNYNYNFTNYGVSQFNNNLINSVCDVTNANFQNTIKNTNFSKQYFFTSNFIWRRKGTTDNLLIESTDYLFATMFYYIFML